MHHCDVGVWMEHHFLFDGQNIWLALGNPVLTGVRAPEASIQKLSNFLCQRKMKSSVEICINQFVHQLTKFTLASILPISKHAEYWLCALECHHLNKVIVKLIRHWTHRCIPRRGEQPENVSIGRRLGLFWFGYTKCGKEHAPFQTSLSISSKLTPPSGQTKPITTVCWRTQFSLGWNARVGKSALKQHMMTSSNGTIFRVTGHLCGEFTGPRWIPHTKAGDVKPLMFSLICVWINGWVNNGEAGDMRRYRAHYDIAVMNLTDIETDNVTGNRSVHTHGIDCDCTCNLQGTVVHVSSFWETILSAMHGLVLDIFVRLSVYQ